MKIYINKILKTFTLSPIPFTEVFEVPDNLSKCIQVQRGVIQKKNSLNQLIYKTKDIPFKETTEAITVLKYENKEVINHYVDGDGVLHEDVGVIQIPIEWINNAPLLIPNIVNEVTTFLNSSSEFTVDDLIIAKYRSVLEKSNYDYIIANEFIEQSINIEDERHSANTGVGFIQLLPKGQAKTEKILLDAETSILELLSYEGDSKVELYVNDVKVQNNKVSLSSKTNNVIVTFKNPTDKALLINAYALGY